MRNHCGQVWSPNRLVACRPLDAIVSQHSSMSLRIGATGLPNYMDASNIAR
jgi:hypothetical protein